MPCIIRSTAAPAAFFSLPVPTGVGKSSSDLAFCHPLVLGSVTSNWQGGALAKLLAALSSPVLAQ
eukprot:1118273-Amphidinium_carterae.1